MEETITQDLTLALTFSDTVMRQTNTNISQCKICGAPALYSYYGAIVCHSCKMFFRRNAEHGQAVLKCDFDDECEVNINNRRICPSCRLAKCFANGMSVELIRFSGITKNKIDRKEKLINDKTLSKTTVLGRLEGKHESEQITTLNLLQSDQSSLTVDEWNLLSNLVRCFDEHSDYSFIERFINEQNSLPMKLRFKCSSVKDFFTSINTKIQLVFEKNRDFLSLSLHDRTTLLRNTVEYTTGVGGMFILRQSRLFDYPTFYNSAEIIFSPAAAALGKRVIDQFDSDDTFIKLILAALGFSTTNYTVYNGNVQTNLTNTKAILPTQDMYIELAWRYLLHKYDYHQSVVRFSNFLRCLLLVNNAIAEAYESKQYTEMIDYVIEKTEQALSL